MLQSGARNARTRFVIFEIRATAEVASIETGNFHEK